jgi:hypothetical protein
MLDDDRPNLARFLFLDEEAPSAFYPEWDRIADGHNHRLRAAAARDQHDRALQRLIGELSTHSLHIRGLWSAQRARACHPTRQRVHHPVVGDPELTRGDLVPVQRPAPSGRERRPTSGCTSWPA